MWLLCCYSMSYYFQVRAEDADVLINHSSCTNHPFFLSLIWCQDDPKNCTTCSLVIPSLVVILLLPFRPWVLQTLIFLDVHASNDEVIRSGISIFQYIYHAPSTALAAIRYSVFSQKAAAGLSKPEYLQQRVQLHSILSIPIYKPRTGCYCRAYLWTQLLWMDITE